MLPAFWRAQSTPLHVEFKTKNLTFRAFNVGFRYALLVSAVCHDIGHPGPGISCGEPCDKFCSFVRQIATHRLSESVAI